MIIFNCSKLNLYICEKFKNKTISYDFKKPFFVSRYGFNMQSWF